MDKQKIKGYELLAELVTKETFKYGTITALILLALYYGLTRIIIPANYWTIQVNIILAVTAYLATFLYESYFIKKMFNRA